jgi:hypothetical protein
MMTLFYLNDKGIKKRHKNNKTLICETLAQVSKKVLNKE